MLGYSDVIWWLDLADGRKISQYVNKYDVAVGIRELNEQFISLTEKSK